MPRGRTITIEQEQYVLALYNKGGVGIKDIMKLTNIKSEQTIYRLLDQNRVPRRPKLNGVAKIFVTIEEDVRLILKQQSNISLYINNAIRHYDKNK